MNSAVCLIGLVNVKGKKRADLDRVPVGPENHFTIAPNQSACADPP